MTPEQQQQAVDQNTKVLIPIQTLATISNYLTQRPYREVRGLIDLMNSTVETVEPEKTPEKEPDEEDKGSVLNGRKQPKAKGQ